MRRRLYPIPNTSRASWCFLVLQSQVKDEERQITGWELAVGNSDQLVATTAMSEEDVDDEAALLAGLMEELGQHRDARPELYTFSVKCLKLLRTRLVLVDHEPLSLRGYRHIVIRDLLDFFGPWWPEILRTMDVEGGLDEKATVTYGEFISSDELWQLRYRVGSLFPPNSLEGEML